MRFLIIDDNERLGQIEKRLIQKFHPEAEVYVTKNIKEAIEVLKNHEIYTVLLDKELENEDGIKSILLLMEVNPYDIDIIVLSACLSDEDCLEAFEFGAKAVIQKPLTEERIELLFERKKVLI